MTFLNGMSHYLKPFTPLEVEAHLHKYMPKEIFVTTITAEDSMKLVWGCFSGAGLGPLIKDILGNFMLPTLWVQFGVGPFLFQHGCAPVHKAMSIKTWITLCRPVNFIHNTES